MINENNSDCCKCTDPEYILEFNEQGPQGRQGKQGEAGFSPLITVDTNTYDTYILKILDANGEFTTPNLKSTLPAGGVKGNVLTKVSDTDGDVAFQQLPQASIDDLGVVQLATVDDFTPDDVGDIDDSKAVTPNTLTEYLPENYVTLDTTQKITGQKGFYNVDNMYFAKNDVSSAVEPDGNWISLMGHSNAEIYFKTSSKYSSIGNNSNEFYIHSDNDIELKAGTRNTEDVIINAGNVTANLSGSATINNNKIIDVSDIATTSSLGIVKPDGTTITIAEDGTISGAQTYELPIASADTLGGIKIGEGLSISDDGTVTVTGGSLDNYVDLTSEQTISGIKTFSGGIITTNISTGKDGKYLTIGDGSVYLGRTDHSLYLSTSSSINVLRNNNTYSILDTGNISSYVDGTNIQWVDNKLTCNLDEIGNQVTELAGRVTTAETTLSTVETQVDTNTADIAELQEALTNSNELVAGTNISIVEDTSAKTTTINCTLNTTSLETKITSLETQLAAALERITALETAIDGGNA